jgi:chromosome segregation protein
VRRELAGLYRDYIAAERSRIENERADESHERRRLESELAELNRVEAGFRSGERRDSYPSEETLKKLSEALELKRKEKESAARTLAMTEGKIAGMPNFSLEQNTTCPLCGQELRRGDEKEFAKEHERKIFGLEAERKEAEARLALLVRQESEAERNFTAERERVEAERRGFLQREREEDEKRLKERVRKNEVTTRLAVIAERAQALVRVEEDFNATVREAVELLGRDAPLLKEAAPSAFDQKLQDERRREIEKKKIKIEALAGEDVGGTDTLEEYKEVSERDAFLGREITDLEKSEASLQVVLKELNGKLRAEFKESIEKINTQFQDFFSIIFGGGSAHLSVVEEHRGREDEASPEEERETETGIEVNVNAPRKKLRGLQMLSGGERALTSIALLFAISQVNPPPFLILDEADAALDETNSQKYGDILERLSRHSQLIVITHNRETMARAGVLYGITTGTDATSKVLSIKLGESEGNLALDSRS